MKPKPPMSMMAFLATEGGRKCPQCGKFAKSEELGNISIPGPDYHISMHGHLPGFGCNKSR